jgi:DNA polymerase-3 subunit beta
MKLKVLKEELTFGLSVVSRIATRNPNLPILEGVLLNAEKNSLSLTTTDLEVGTKWWVLAKVEKPGKVVIPARVVSDLVKLISDRELQLESDKKSLLIKYQNGENQIQGLEVNDFPLLPEAEGKTSVWVDSFKFCQGLKQILYCVASSESRPEISGVYLQFEAKRIIMVATDSFRLAEKIVEPVEKVQGDIKKLTFILPVKTAQQVIAVFETMGKSIKIYLSPDQMVFESDVDGASHPQVQIVSRLIEGTYPDYQGVIPKSFKTNVKLSRSQLLNKIKAANLFSDQVREVQLAIRPKEKKVYIESRSTKIGKSKASISATIKGEDLDISFNSKYLIDVLSNLSNEEIELKLNDGEKAGLLKPAGDTFYRYVLMPIKSA